MLNIYQHLSTAPQLNLQDLFQQMAPFPSTTPWTLIIIQKDCKNGHNNDVVLDAAEDVGDS